MDTISYILSCDQENLPGISMVLMVKTRANSQLVPGRPEKEMSESMISFSVPSWQEKGWVGEGNVVHVHFSQPTVMPKLYVITKTLCFIFSFQFTLTKYNII